MKPSSLEIFLICVLVSSSCGIINQCSVRCEDVWTAGIWTLTPYILKTSFMSPALMVSFCSLSLSCKHPVTVTTTTS